MIWEPKGREPQFTEEEAAARASFSAAGLNLAGHQVTDPYLVRLGERHARGELTAEEVLEATRWYIVARRPGSGMSLADGPQS